MLIPLVVVDHLGSEDNPFNQFDLESANQEALIRVVTTDCEYRFSFREDAELSTVWLYGVTMTSSSPAPKKLESVDTFVNRYIGLNEPLRYGAEGRTSPVVAVYVGGVRVLGRA